VQWIKARTMRRLGCAVLGATLAACSGISFEDQNKVEGTYTLRSILGAPLPYALGDGQSAIITSGVLTLEGDGDWSEVLSYTIPENGQLVSKVSSDGGRWVLRNPNVELLASSGGAYYGTYSNLNGPKLELARPVPRQQSLYVYTR
jgi:hypothetical protein